MSENKSPKLTKGSGFHLQLTVTNKNPEDIATVEFNFTGIMGSGIRAKCLNDEPEINDNVAIDLAYPRIEDDTMPSDNMIVRLISHRIPDVGKVSDVLTPEILSNLDERFADAISGMTQLCLDLSYEVGKNAKGRFFPESMTFFYGDEDMHGDTCTPLMFMNPYQFNPNLVDMHVRRVKENNPLSLMAVSLPPNTETTFIFMGVDGEG